MSAKKQRDEQSVLDPMIEARKRAQSCASICTCFPPINSMHPPNWQLHGLDETFTLATDVLVCSLGGAYHCKALPSATAVVLKQVIVSLNMLNAGHI
jgi:hypothetical protein